MPKGKSNKFEEYVNSLPVEFNVIQELNKWLKGRSIRERRMLIEDKPPVDIYGECKEIFNGVQYDDSVDCGTRVWHLPKFDKYIAVQYYSNSYDGDDYSDSDYYEVKPIEKTITIYEQI